MNKVCQGMTWGEKSLLKQCGNGRMSKTSPIWQRFYPESKEQSIDAILSWFKTSVIDYFLYFLK